MNPNRNHGQPTPPPSISEIVRQAAEAGIVAEPALSPLMEMEVVFRDQAGRLLVSSAISLKGAAKWIRRHQRQQAQTTATTR